MEEAGCGESGGLKSAGMAKVSWAEVLMFRTAKLGDRRKLSPTARELWILVVLNQDYT